MKYCPEIVEEIAGYITDGHTQEDAATLADIGETTFYEWMQKYPKFSEAIKKAHASFKKENLEIVKKAAKAGTWTAASWILERRYKKDYALKTEVETNMSISGGMAVEINSDGEAPDIEDYTVQDD